MPETLTVYIDRDKKTVLDLEYIPEGSSTYESVPEDTVLRAIFRFGPFCIDTDSSDLIELSEDATSIEMNLGLITSLVAGGYVGYLTIYDAENTNGIPWQQYQVNVLAWDVCPED
jgi:hypothetical protein